jgi:hypothetical protein
MMKSDAVKQFLNFYKTFDLSDSNLFDSVYDQDIKFIDPFHTVHGNKNLFTYFKRLTDNVLDCNFVIIGVLPGEMKSSDVDPDLNSAVVFWDMHYKHKKLNAGNEIKVSGCSLIHYKERVVFHQDYFDSSQMLYRNIPIVGSVIRFIEGRI